MLNENEIVISLDCCGGDNSPRSVVGGMLIFLKKKFHGKVKFLLFGDEDVLKNELKCCERFKDRYKVIHCNKKIDNCEKPSIALRKGRDSSMGMAIESVKSGEANACISAGNT
jgi:glycerol-3-phosphate acyltransferase PlsX